jgi:CheY-like chemotaxis protein
MMPELDGFGVAQAMHAHEVWRTIPVVVMTAKDITAEDRARLNGSVEQILQKGTFGTEDLVKSILRYVPVSRPAGKRGAS